MSTPSDFSFPSGNISVVPFIKTIGPYRFQSCRIHSDLVDEHYLTYPSIGYVNVDMTVSDDFELTFENYPFVRGKVGQINVGGIITGDPLICRQRGSVSFYTMRWHPVMVYHMFKQSMHQLSNSFPVLTDILPKQHNLLNRLEEEQVCESWSNPYLEKVLLELFPPVEKLINDPIYHAVNWIAETNGRIKVSELAEEFAMNERTFNRQFLKKVGVTPQILCENMATAISSRNTQWEPHHKTSGLSFFSRLLRCITSY